MFHFMKIFTIIFGSLLFLLDTVWLIILTRFMFFKRWDITSQIFKDMTYFWIVFPQYLELILLLVSMILLVHRFQEIEHPIVVAIALNAFALGLFVFIGMKM
jgi:hypothetical protein